MNTWITILLIPVFLAGLGLVLISGKGDHLIAGYNTMTPERKAHVNIRKLSVFIGRMTVAVSGSVFLIFYGRAFHNDAALTLGCILSAIFILFMLIYSNTSRMFKL